MIIFFNKEYFSILLILLISISLSDDKKALKNLELKQKVKGKMDQNESREYYQLKLPKDVPVGSLLIFTVKESRKGVKEGEELFSDPDIYISKTTKYPSNREEADWYSERYGNDILTVPSFAVDSEEIFYICMYCQYKCRYELYSYLSKEVPAELGKYYTFTLTKQSSISYALYVPANENKEELNVIASNPSLKNFRIFMAKESPSSQNTFQIMPAWTGGYAISVTKYNKDYCTDCTYHILFQTEEKSINIQFTAYFQSTLTKVNSGNPINDVIKSGSRRCYYFDTSNIDNLYKSKLAINANLYSGSIILSISGWRQKEEDKNLKAKNEPYSFHIENDKVILLQKEDFEKFDKEIYSSEANEGKKLYFCLYGQQMTSYFLNIYFLSEAQELQRFNFISPGSELTGYLEGGQLTRYRILDFNLNKNSVITLSFTSLQGKVEFFSTFCKDNCKFDDELLKDGLENGIVTMATDITFQKKNIIIKPEDNKCYKEEMEDQISKCKTLVIVKCFGTSDDVCSFKILPTISDQAIYMYPKKTYYNIIPKGKTDIYEILVNDEEVNSIVVVLTSVTGDAELQVEKVVEKNEDSNFKGKLSRNKNYIPDVVRITPNLLGGKSVAGKYIVKITGASFSSYNLYYYTTRIKTKNEQPDLKDITLSLGEGNIIKDYFPNDISYKIFSYTPQTKEKEDIKIILTRINVHFSFKVYLDFSKIKYNYDIESKYEERLTNYDWASDQNNELTIFTNDKKYSNNGPYYIVVTRDNTYQDDENEELEVSSLMMYYLGVTKKGVPFNLNEGIEHQETLSESYLSQNYFYIHKDTNNPFILEINVLNGEVDVYIDVKEIKKETINKNELLKNEEDEQNSLYLNFGISNYRSIELHKKYFDKFCIRKDKAEIEDRTCSLFIYVVQSKSSRKYHRDSQYIINAKSSINAGTLLLSGQVYNAKSKDNATDHYIIEEVKHRKGTSINIKFKKGGGQIYVRIPKSPEVGRNITFPDNSNYDYKGMDTYMGKIVTIPPKVFDRINSNSLKLQILITVLPTKEGFDLEDVEYSITYGSEPKRISQNVPYQSFVSAGEHHYFTFYFDETTENIYISLSNMNGDADMYLNYGDDKLPNSNSYDWSSTNLGHEYIDINVKDRYFKKNKKENMSGYYTLLIVGFTETTYTLYVSSHADKIFPLIDNTPINCQCQIKGEKCYFRYDNVFIGQYNERMNNIKKNEIIFTNQYIYGDGNMYASIYKDQELEDEPNKKYQEFFPDEENHQFSNSKTGNRNYLKVTVENQYYSKDSLILLTYICEEKTDVEITSASLQYTPLYTYIDQNRENMFYIKYNESISSSKQEESILNFYSINDEVLIYEFHAYTGAARVKIYTNESIFDEKNELEKFDYNHIAEFNIRAENDDSYKNIKMYTENYFNSIKNNLIFNKNVYFSIKPMSDFSFYVQVNYDRTWVNIPIGETKSYLINNNLMAGYFDINNEFSNVELTLTLDEFIIKRATIFIKILVLSKDAKRISSSNVEDKLYHYEIPSNLNYDYKGKTNSILGTFTINMNNLPILNDYEKNNKFIRALFSIEIKKNLFLRKDKQTTEVNNMQNNNPFVSPQTKVTIGVIPGINNFKRIDLPQKTFYFSNTSLVPNSQSNVGYNNYDSRQFDGNKEVKIFSLDKRSNEDRKMVIKLYSCSGSYNFKLTNKIVDYDKNENNIPAEKKVEKNGGNKILINNLRHRHLYLSIKSSQIPQDCNFGKERDSNNVTCSNELSYLLYYYTFKDYEYSEKGKELDLQYKYSNKNNTQITLIMSPTEKKENLNNIFWYKNYEYNLFWTENEALKEYLNNICYLSQILNKNEENNNNFTSGNGNDIKIIRNIDINQKGEYIINNLDTKGKYYLNILARNLKTNELLAYTPLEGITTKKSSTFKKIFISFLVIGLLATVIYISFNYYKDNIYNASELSNNPSFPSGIGMSNINSKQGGYQRISL